MEKNIRWLWSFFFLLFWDKFDNCSSKKGRQRIQTLNLEFKNTDLASASLDNEITAKNLIY